MRRLVCDATPLILAGGLGTRLRSVVGAYPKVLAPIQGRPFVTYVLDQLAAAGFRRVVLLTGFGADQVRQTLGDAYRGLALAYSPEASPLGTGGAIRAALGHVRTAALLLLNGDSSFPLDWHAFAAYQRRTEAELTLALTEVADAGRFGLVECDARGRVTKFREKQTPGGPGWINAGVYLLARHLLDDVPADEPVSLERDLMPQWVRERAVFGFPAAGPLHDIGTPESYQAAQTFFSQLKGFVPPLLRQDSTTRL